jgi:hypothetical protein
LSRGNDEAIKIHENRLAKIEADTASLKIDTAILKWMMARARPDPRTAAFAARR